MKNETETAKIASLKWHKDGESSVWLVRVTCPFCGAVHKHGGGNNPAGPDLGHRVADCGRGGYDIIYGKQVEILPVTPGGQSRPRNKAEGRGRF